MAGRLLGRRSVAFPLDFCRPAVGAAQVLGFWMAMAVVVLDPIRLVHTMAHLRLDMVAGLVGMVGLDMVAFPLDILAVLVGGFIQRIKYLAVATEKISLLHHISPFPKNRPWKLLETKKDYLKTLGRVPF